MRIQTKIKKYDYPQKSFDEVKTESHDKWEAVLSQIEIETKDNKKKELFYTPSGGNQYVYNGRTSIAYCNNPIRYSI